MQVELGEKIKELRKRDGRKQEDLAVALGVTKQAVSRWEANGGYPDMQMLPAIANYFHITIDELFGYDNDRQTKLQSYIDQADQIYKRKDIMLLVEFLRNAVSEFPSEWQLQCRLANALVIVGYQKVITAEGDDIRHNTEDQAQNEYWKEAISLYEEALKKEIDDGYRAGTIGSLLSLYANMGDFENAERIALSQSPVKISREVLLTRAAEGEKADGYRGEAILALMHELYQVIEASVTAKHSPVHSQGALEVVLALARLYESIFEDGNYGSFHNDICMLYLRCSSIAVHLDDTEHALNYFENALEHFIEFGHLAKSDKLREAYQLTAPLVGKAKSGAGSFVVMDHGWVESYMQSFPAECADAIRNNPKYAPIFAQ